MSQMVTDWRGRDWLQALSFFGGPAIWALELLIGYGLASVSCTANNKLSVYILATLVILGVMAAGYVAYHAWSRQAQAGKPSLDELDAKEGRKEFVVMSGFMISALFFLLVLITGVFSIFLSPCPAITLPFP
jgi:hypothetical protein